MWEEIPDLPNVDREGTLALVAGRLFAGYDVEVAPAGPAVSLVPRGASSWDVKLILPELRDMALEWFRTDVRGLDKEAAGLLRSLPQAALTWADDALKEALSTVVERRLPGWDLSVQAALGETGGVLTLAFRPRPPLVLAFSPTLYSRTIPAMFQSDLEAKLIPGLSPLIGIPVECATRHQSDVERAARNFLADRNAVENLRAQVSVTFTPGPMSGLDARVDSDRFLFQVWVAAYAGLDGRYPEAGLFFGWNTAHLTGIDLELYVELIAELDNLGVSHRLGLRTRFLNNLWAGVELAWPGDEWFWRVQWGPGRIRRPYLWWRWSPDLGHEGAVGYRLDEHISVEIYYDGTGSDRVGLRGLWAL